MNQSQPFGPTGFDSSTVRLIVVPIEENWHLEACCTTRRVGTRTPSNERRGVNRRAQ